MGHFHEKDPEIQVLMSNIVISSIFILPFTISYYTLLFRVTGHILKRMCKSQVRKTNVQTHNIAMKWKFHNTLKEHLILGRK